MRNQEKWEQVESDILFGLPTYCFYEKLSNGQVLGVYFQRNSILTFNFAVTIRDTAYECDVWLRDDDRKITGNCGLEGLCKAFRILKWFINNRLPKGKRIKVHGHGRRGKAYRILKRIGFRTEFSNQEESQYVYKRKDETQNPFDVSFRF